MDRPDDVRFAKAINRPMYPVEWLITSSAGQRTAGGGGGEGGNKGGNTLRFVIDNGISVSRQELMIIWQATTNKNYKEQHDGGQCVCTLFGWAIP